MPGNFGKTIRKHGVVGTLLRDLADRPGVYCGRTDGRRDGHGNPR